MEDSKNNRSEFLSLFMANHKLIYSYILALVCNVADADDLMQETALILWDHFDQYKSGTNFGAWARSISRYKILQHFDKTKNTPVSLSPELLDAIEKDVTRQLSAVDERYKALRQCLEKLPLEHRFLLQEKYDKGLHVPQIAKTIGNNANVLYKKMAQIHNILLHCINRAIGEEKTI